MARTHKKVRYSSKGNREIAPAEEFGVAEEALKTIEGRWKLRILVHLRARSVMRFSDLKRAIPSVTQKMLIQQLRELERDGAVKRKSRRASSTASHHGDKTSAQRSMPCVPGRGAGRATRNEDPFSALPSTIFLPSS
jgi:hypothetical protein